MAEGLKLLRVGGRDVWLLPDGRALSAISGAQEWDDTWADPWAPDDIGQGALPSWDVGGGPNTDIPTEFNNLWVDPQDGKITEGPDGPPAPPSMLEKLTNFLTSKNMLGALATLGLGLGASAAGRAFAGTPRPITPPSFSPASFSPASFSPASITGNPLLDRGQALAAEVMGEEGATRDIRAALRSGFGGYSTMGSLVNEELNRQAYEARDNEAANRAIRDRALIQMREYIPDDDEPERIIARLKQLDPMIAANLAATPESRDALLNPLRDQSAKLLREGVDPFRVADPVEAAFRARVLSTTGKGPEGFAVTDPVEGGMRSTVLKTLAGGPEAFAVNDPVGSAIRERLLKAIRGEEVDPALEQRITLQREVLNNRLKQMYGLRAGGDVEGTVGAKAGIDYDAAANMLRYGVNRDVMALLSPEERARMQFAKLTPEQQYLSRLTAMAPQEAARRVFSINNPESLYLSELNSLSPQEQARRQFSINNPYNLYLANLGFFVPEERARTAQDWSNILGERSSLLGAENLAQTARSRGLAEQAALTGFGRRDLSQLSSGLNSLFQFSPFLNLNDAGTRTAQASLTQGASGANAGFAQGAGSQNAGFAQGAAGANAGFNLNAALEQFRADAANRASLAQGFGKLGGNVADALLYGGPRKPITLQVA